MAPKLKDYVNDIEPSGFACYWSPAGEWIRAHGDGKSSTGGKFWTETMTGSDGKYHVRIKNGKSVAMSFSLDEEPSVEKVVAEMKQRI